jgi:hypothetical protein
MSEYLSGKTGSLRAVIPVPIQEAIADESLA